MTSRIAPPVPAPYLVGVPSLPDDVRAALDGRRARDAAAVAAARETVARLRQLIRRARSRYEAERGICIIPEPPLQP
jgi:hypothetical protein